MRTFGPHATDLNELAAVAGLRWTIEECFQSAKGETGLIIARLAWLASAHDAIDGGAGLSLRLAGRLKETQIDIASAKTNKRSPSAAA